MQSVKVNHVVAELPFVGKVPTSAEKVQGAMFIPR